MSFTPAKHGFHFKNSDIEWAVDIPIPLLGLTYTASGKQLCGGMVYSALDFFLGGKNIPNDTTAPGLGTRLNNYITERQASAHLGTGHRFLFRWTPRGRYEMGQEAQDEIDKLRKLLQTSPIPLCIVRQSSGHHLLAMGVTGDASNVTIKAYDPGVPDVTCTLSGNPKSGYVNSRNNDSFLGFFVDDSYSHSKPANISASAPATGVEGDWRWCQVCQALFFEGGSHNGRCPKGGWHSPGGKKKYVLNRSGGSGESGWKWCHACQGLFWPSGGSTGSCSGRSGGHDNSDGWDYVVRTSASSVTSTEDGWRYCRGCRLLYHGGDTGACPSGGGAHNRDSPTAYFLEYA
jgi:hypothetical protein